MRRESHSREKKPVERKYTRSNSLFLTPTIQQETILAKPSAYA